MLADQHESCNEQGCPIDCEGEWGPWGECMAPCGTLGAQIRRFSVRQHEQFGGRRESCDAADGQAESRNCTGVQHCLHSSAGLLASFGLESVDIQWWWVALGAVLCCCCVGCATDCKPCGGGEDWTQLSDGEEQADEEEAFPDGVRIYSSPSSPRQRQSTRRDDGDDESGSLVAPSDRSSSRPAEAPRAAAELDESVQVSPSRDVMTSTEANRLFDAESEFDAETDRLARDGTPEATSALAEFDRETESMSTGQSPWRGQRPPRRSDASAASILAAGGLTRVTAAGHGIGGDGSTAFSPRSPQYRLEPEMPEPEPEPEPEPWRSPPPQQGQSGPAPTMSFDIQAEAARV